MLISALLHKILKCLSFTASALLHILWWFYHPDINPIYDCVSGLYKKLGVGFPIPNNALLISKDDVWEKIESNSHEN